MPPLVSILAKDIIDEPTEIRKINISDEHIIDENIEAEYIEDDIIDEIIDEAEVPIESLEDIDPINVIKIDYTIMNVSDLRKQVKDKQLSSNSSKLKKQELLDLLVSN